MIDAPETLRRVIGQRARKLRQERHWTQAALAKVLGLSQNRLSEVEHGKGSFTAEQLLTILKTFNVPIDYFAPPKATVSELQNALARLGAAHLAESVEVLPTERLKEALAVIREVLAVAESPRQITGLAPVLVNHAASLNLAKLRAELWEIGLSGRLGWLVENTYQALDAEIRTKKLSARWVARYHRAQAALNLFLSVWSKQKIIASGSPEEDILDPGIASTETLREVKEGRSEVSRGWSIVTRIRPEDFQRALEDARGAD